MRFHHSPAGGAGGQAAPPAHAGVVEEKPAASFVWAGVNGQPLRVGQQLCGAESDEVTNTETGAKTLADASGSALVEHHADGTHTWFVVGPVLLGFRENAGTLPRGLWIVDGVFTVQLSPDLIHKTITMVRGTTHNVCTDID